MPRSLAPAATVSQTPDVDALRDGENADSVSPSRRRRELLADCRGLLFLIAVVYFAVALFTFDPHDLGEIAQPVNAEVQNLGGALGARLAATAYEHLGVGAYAVLLVLAVWAGVAFATRRFEDVLTRSFGAVLLVGSIATIAAAAPPLTPASCSGGGTFGYAMFAIMGSSLGTPGTIVMLSFVALVALVLATDRTLLDCAKWMLVTVTGLGERVVRATRIDGAEDARGAEFDDDGMDLEEGDESSATGDTSTRRRRRAGATRRIGRQAVDSTTRTGLTDSLILTADDVFADDELADLASEVDDASSTGRDDAADRGAKKGRVKLLRTAAKATAGNAAVAEWEGDDDEDAEAGAEPTLPKPITGVKSASPGPFAPTKTAKLAARNYALPPVELLQEAPKVDRGALDSAGREQALLLQQALESFRVEAKVSRIERGPTVTRFELEVPPGTKVKKILGLGEDLALAMRVASVRVVAPIPGRGTIGIEAPNDVQETVSLREMLNSGQFDDSRHAIPIVWGRDVVGEPVYADLAAMPHLLIAGTTGSGKSVAASVIVMTTLLLRHYDQVKFVMIDPKMVEFAPYRDIPHLLLPVVTDPTKAAEVMDFLVIEMENRYKLLERTGCKHLSEYNALDDEEWEERLASAGLGKDELDSVPRQLPYIVALVDELADLMMVAGKQIEESICRLAQKSRAIGIHLVLATQRPSVDVITGLIKANIPCRMAFRVISSIDSKTILDRVGADKLLGRGDMLYMAPGKADAIRAQCCFVSNDEIRQVVKHIRSLSGPCYAELPNANARTQNGATRRTRSGAPTTHGTAVRSATGPTAPNAGAQLRSVRRDAAAVDEGSDELLGEAARIVCESQRGSASMLQRELGIGYTRAARLIELLEVEGAIGPHQGAKQRDVLWTVDDVRKHFPDAA